MGLTTQLLINRGKVCDRGYYCPGTGTIGAQKPYNVTSGDVGVQKCESGHYCPANSINQIPCAAGYYEPREGSYEC